VIAEILSAHEDVGWFPNYLNKLPSLPAVAFLSRLVDLPWIGHNLRGKKQQSSGLLSMISKYLPYSVEAFPVWRRCCGDKFLWEYLIHSNASQSERKCVQTLISNVLYFQDKSRFITKYTGPPKIHYMNSIFPDAIFIHVIRDPRAVVSSLLKVQFWSQGGGFTQPWWKNGLSAEFLQEWHRYGSSPSALAAVQWKQIIEIAWEEKSHLENERYFEIRYEDFVEDPNRVIDDICHKVGLRPCNSLSAYIISSRKISDMNKKYLDHLTLSDIGTIEVICRATAAIVGYDL
jgi:hypothetical protein